MNLIIRHSDAYSIAKQHWDFSVVDTHLEEATTRTPKYWILNVSTLPKSQPTRGGDHPHSELNKTIMHHSLIQEAALGYESVTCCQTTWGGDYPHSKLDIFNLSPLQKAALRLQSFRNNSQREGATTHTPNYIFYLSPLQKQLWDSSSRRGRPPALRSSKPLTSRTWHPKIRQHWDFSLVDTHLEGATARAPNNFLLPSLVMRTWPVI